MKPKVSVLAALVAALCIARVSAAQDAPAAGSAPAEPTAQPPPPPQGYPPPPPRATSQPGGYQYPQQYPPPPPNQYPPNQYPPTYWAPNQPRGYGYYPQAQGAIYRPFSFTIGVGPGYLHGWGNSADAESAVALSYNLFRLGFGIAPNTSFVIAFEGTGTNSTSPLTGEQSWLRQENWLLGVQYHIVPRLYIRGGVGAGFISEHSFSADVSGGTGIATAGAIGWEFVQTPHVALALDANGSVTKYSDQYWSTAGLNLAVSFF
jgi:hypothetical protein